MAEKLRVCDLAKAYDGFRAVNGLSFHVAAGEIFGLLGTNGAGKTTTLECIVGLRTPDMGSIEVCGLDLSKHPTEVKRRIGVVLQSTALQDRITPREALDLFGAFHARRTDTRGLLERFALVEKADAPFDTLSDGQKQRLALALAFVNEPELVILDEPTAGLDAHSRRELHRLILRLREEGRAVLLTTHYIEEAQVLCDRVAVMNAGGIVAEGKPSDLLALFQGTSRIVARTRRPMDAVAAGAFLPSVQTQTPPPAEMDGDGEITIDTREVGVAVIALVHALEAQGNELLDLRVEKPSLEDLFLELTREAAQ